MCESQPLLAQPVCVCVCAWLLQVAATSTMEGSLMALLADPSRKLLTPRECRVYAAGSGSGRSLSLQLGPLGKPLAAISPYNNKARSKTEKEWRSMKAKVRARLWRGAFWASRPTRLRRGAVRSTLPAATKDRWEIEGRDEGGSCDDSELGDQIVEIVDCEEDVTEDLERNVDCVTCGEPFPMCTMYMGMCFTCAEVWAEDHANFKRARRKRVRW